MNLLGRRIVTTSDGVYQPPPLRQEAALLALVLPFILAGMTLGQLSPAFALLYLVLLVVPFLFRLMAYRKFGPLGQPSVAIADGTLVFSRPEDSRGAMKFVLSELRRVQVYGRDGRRTYRFELRDGSFVEAVPLWGRRVEACVIAFLQTALPLQVTVAQPQSLFASIRGDGP